MTNLHNTNSNFYNLLYTKLSTLFNEYILNKTNKSNKSNESNVNNIDNTEVCILSQQVLSSELIKELSYKLLDIDNLDNLLKKTDKLLYNELEFFTSNDLSGNTKSFYDIINHTYTISGSSYLKSIILNTITDFEVLHQRQNNLNFFSSLSKEIKADLNNSLQNISNYESDIYWHINVNDTTKPSEMKEVLDVLFFTKSWNKSLNLKEQFVNLYYYFIILFTPLWGALGPIIVFFIPYLITRYVLKVPIPFKFYVNNLKGMLFGNQFFAMIKLAQKAFTVMTGSSNNANGSILDNIKNKLTNTVMNIITGNFGRYIYFILIIGSYLWGIYNSVLVSINYNKLINFIHTKMNNIRHMLNTSIKFLKLCDFNVYNISKQENSKVVNDNEYSQVNGKCRIVCNIFNKIATDCHQALQENDIIKFILSNKTFNSSPGLFNNKGVILKSYYILSKTLENNNNVLQPFIKLISYIDCWYSTSKLLSTHNFNLPTYNPSSIPILQMSGIFSPVCINTNNINSTNTTNFVTNVVTNDLDLCYPGIEVDVKEEDNEEEEEENEEEEVDVKEEEKEEIKEEEDINNNKPNCLLTGPNGSGKSTYLKSVMCSVICAQTLGLVPANKCIITPFEYISTYLNIPDCQGKESLFQAEMSRCHQHLEKLKELELSGKLSFNIMDEIFVSTNYLEGMSGAYAVVKNLENYKHSLNLITTHFDKLVENKLDTYQYKYFTIDSSIDEITGEDIIHKDYKLRDGINDKHLALHLLKLRGFDKQLVDDAKKMYNDLTSNINNIDNEEQTDDDNEEQTDDVNNEEQTDDDNEEQTDDNEEQNSDVNNKKQNTDVNSDTNNDIDTNTDIDTDNDNEETKC